MRRWRLALLGFAIALAALVASRRPLAFWLADRQIAWRYGDVASLGTQELADWLADAKRDAPLLLDARGQQEYDVSRLPGARRADAARPDLDALAGRPRDAPLVVYCSVGWRSAQLARALQSAGFTRVYNLRGGVFRWANQGRPLEGPHGPATRVHPFDGRGALLLEPDRRAPLPGAR
jgi:rhodanese-related sulfurtransferase